MVCKIITAQHQEITRLLFLLHVMANELDKRPNDPPFKYKFESLKPKYLVFNYHEIFIADQKKYILGA